jgi:hypothetical protein
VTLTKVQIFYILMSSLNLVCLFKDAWLLWIIFICIWILESTCQFLQTYHAGILNGNVLNYTYFWQYWSLNSKPCAPLSTIWDMPPQSFFCFSYCSGRVLLFFPRAGLGPWSSQSLPPECLGLQACITMPGQGCTEIFRSVWGELVHHHHVVSFNIYYKLQ